MAQNQHFPSTLLELLARSAAEAAPDQPALRAPGRPDLSYPALLREVEAAAAVLRGAGAGGGETIGLILPDGPEMAVAFLAASTVGAAAPLNPAYREAEFAFYLEDLGVQTLLAPGDVLTGEWLPAAERLGIRVLRVDPAGAEAGRIRIGGGGEPGGVAAPSPGPEDIALVLHTSGTTARPKMVPLSQRNLAVSAANVAATLRLGAADCCLNVMPLFHIHGLVAALLASLHAGASVCCAPGFEAPRFFGWLRACGATWYTAVPTMHQAILRRAREAGEMPPDPALRFLRSSSAALPPSVLHDLEAFFGAPVVEAYGMTEAAHQMASNPLPPAERRPGSVGLPAGPEITVRDAAGLPCPAGREGEICIRGANVFSGYLNRPEANAEAFVDGWFRTGDLGRLDAGGFLWVTGRSKEIINRGGEKISPREVDEVLLGLPGVAQAVAFAVPDERLGEEIAAAVVLQPGAAVTETELRRGAAERLADFKVPRRIFFVPEIPKGPTGKIQRLRLADQLGIRALERSAESRHSPCVAGAAGAREHGWLRVLWQEILGIDTVEDGDLFLALGGDSVLAARLAVRITEETGISVPVLELLDEATLAGMADRVAAAREQAAAASPAGGAAAAEDDAELLRALLGGEEIRAEGSRQSP